MVSDYSTAYEGLEGQVREDLMELERLVEEAVESERCMTSSSLPEGFETEMTDETDFDSNPPKSMIVESKYIWNTKKEAVYRLIDLIHP